jgi:hypothetical protein
MDYFEEEFDDDFDQNTSTQDRFPEKLIRVHSDAGDRSFLVRWEGFDKRNDSWVHESALPSRLVDEYDWGTCGVSVPERDVELQREYDECEVDDESEEDYTPFVYTPLTPEDLEREVRLLNEKFRLSPTVLIECAKEVVVSVKEIVLCVNEVVVSEKSVPVSVTPLEAAPSPKHIQSRPSKLRKTLSNRSPEKKSSPPILMTETQRLQLHSSLFYFLWLSKVKRLNTFSSKPPRPPRPPPDPPSLSLVLSSTLSSPPSQLLGFFYPDRSSVVTVENQCGFLSLLLYTLFSATNSPLHDHAPLEQPLHPRRVVCT